MKDKMWSVAALDKNAWIREWEARSTIYRLVLSDIGAVAQLLE